MERIDKINLFKVCINSCCKISQIGKLKTIDNKNYIFVYDGITCVYCEVPELKKEYEHYINLFILNDLCKSLKDTDILRLDIQKDKINAVVKRPKIEKKYEFANFSDENDKDLQKASDKVFKIKPENEITTSLEWISEQINSLIFRKIDKSMTKVSLNLKKDIFRLLDDNETTGKSIVNLLDFDEYHINYKSDTEVKINWNNVEDILSYLKSFSEKVTLNLQSNYPVKVISKKDGYEIVVLVAPLVENE